MRPIGFSIVALMVVVSATAWATPLRIPVSGKISDAADQPLSGIRSVTFELETSPANMIHQETKDIAFAEGVFGTTLDVSTLSLDVDLLSSDTLDLFVTIDGNRFGPFSVSSSPFALRAARAETLDLTALEAGAGIEMTQQVDGAIQVSVRGGSGAGDITAVETLPGSGLGGGGDSGDVSLHVNLGQCASPEQFVKGTEATGALSCANEVGDISEVVAGSGLRGGGVSGSVRLEVDSPRVLSSLGGCPPGQFASGVQPNGSLRCTPAPGDINSVVAGMGLLGGGVSGPVTLSVNFNDVQRRVRQQCGPDSSIRGILDDGNVLCEPDSTGPGDITGVVAGTGLSGGGTAGEVTLDVDMRHLESSFQAQVTGNCAVGSAIRTIHPNGTVDCRDALVLSCGLGASFTIPSLGSWHALPTLSCEGTTNQTSVYRQMVSGRPIFWFSPPRAGLYRFSLTGGFTVSGPAGDKSHLAKVGLDVGTAGSPPCGTAPERQLASSGLAGGSGVSGAYVLSLRRTDRVAFCGQLGNAGTGVTGGRAETGQTFVTVEELGLVAVP